MEKTKESMMVKEFVEAFEDLSPVEFVEEYNRTFNTNLTIGDIEWDGRDGTN